MAINLDLASLAELVQIPQVGAVRAGALLILQGTEGGVTWEGLNTIGGIDWRVLVRDKVVTFSRSVVEELDWDDGAVGEFSANYSVLCGRKTGTVG